ncbi:MAG TPA: hypothetical protein VFN26_17430, partial [Candidatus Acidoferrum sp.]|nr:hypothetical protein [Candidatus Acidoferrum sp.]
MRSAWHREKVISCTRILSALAAVFVLSQAWVSVQGQTTSYSVTDLGTLGGATSTACGINDLSQVVGKSTIATGQLHAFLWQNGIIIDLGTLSGLSFSEARAVNNRGQAVGDSSAAGGPPFHAVLFENGEVIPLGTLPG